MLGAGGREFLESKRAVIERAARSFGLTAVEATSFVDLLTTVLTDADIEAMRRLRSGRALLRYGSRATATFHSTSLGSWPEPARDPLDFYWPKLVHVLCGDMYVGTSMMSGHETPLFGRFMPSKAFQSIYHTLRRTIAAASPRYGAAHRARFALGDSVLEGRPGMPLTIESGLSTRYPTSDVWLLEREWAAATGTSLMIFATLVARTR